MSWILCKFAVRVELVAKWDRNQFYHEVHCIETLLHITCQIISESKHSIWPAPEVVDGIFEVCPATQFLSFGAGDQLYPYGAQYPQLPPGWIYPCIESARNLTLTVWRAVFFTDFILKCECSFPDKFFVTSRFEVGFVLDKSEIAL